MKRISEKQKLINRELHRQKKELSKICIICHGFGNELMHILPRSLFPEYILKTENLCIGCHECHDRFDNDITFRQEQTKLFDQVAAFDKQAAERYFKL
jgi:nitrate/TMAO reductase-like tetraheme cytochrome c subunit